MAPDLVKRIKCSKGDALATSEAATKSANLEGVTILQVRPASLEQLILKELTQSS